MVLFSFQLIQGQVIEQNANNLQKELFDAHILKKKQNKTAAWIFFGSGAAMVIVGGAINGAEVIAGTMAEAVTLGFAEVEYERKGDWLYYVGAATAAVSVPLFIAAGKHKREANLHLRGDSMTIGNLPIVDSRYLAFGLTLEF